METRYAPLIASLRRAARPDRPAPAELEAYLDKVRLHAYKVVDRDFAELEERGYSEDELFEYTVSAAVAAGLERLDAALRTVA